ncbi:hypothetical protein [Micrococcus luteus]|uniref:hypothetical protein n=1 Tax=Micrococcus luteus TaxID=1270 RepID=UPI003917513E
MGYANAMTVFTSWGHLGHRESRLLAYLALVSRDDGRPPVYFGGWEAAARAIGLDPEGNPASARRNVFKAMSSLTAAGALVPSGAAHTGRRAEYALTLDPARSAVATGAARDGNGRLVTTWAVLDRATGRPVDKSSRIWERGTETVTQRETETVTQKGDRNGPKRETGTVTPTTTDEPHQEYREENIALDATSSTRASAQLRPAAVFLARTPDQGRAALADLLGDGEGLSEAEAVVLAARRAGWVPEAEDVPA